METWKLRVSACAHEASVAGEDAIPTLPLEHKGTRSAILIALKLSQRMQRMDKTTGLDPRVGNWHSVFLYELHVCVKLLDSIVDAGGGKAVASVAGKIRNLIGAMSDM